MSRDDDDDDLERDDEPAAATTAVVEAPSAAAAGLDTSGEVELPVPGFVPLKKDQRPIIQHEVVRAVEKSRPVLPGSNRERLHYAMAQFTARRMMYLFLCGMLVFFFFLLTNHLKLHRSYPVNFPDIDLRKAEVRSIAQWNNDLGNTRLRQRDLDLLSESVAGLDRIRDQKRYEIAEVEGIAPEKVRDKDIANSVTIHDVQEHITAPELRTQIEELQKLIEQIPQVSWLQLNQGDDPGPLREDVELRLGSLGEPVLTKLVKAQLGAAYQKRREDNIEKIRDRDQELRHNYFTLADRKGPATWLFFALAIGFVVSARATWHYDPRTRLPIPNPNKGNEQQREAHYGRWGLIAGAGVLLVVFSSLLVTADRHYFQQPGLLHADVLAANQKLAEERRLARLEEQKQRDALRRQKIEELSVRVDPADFARNPTGFLTKHGHVTTASIPANSQTVLWEAATPLSGMSSPVIWNDRVVISAATTGQLRLVAYGLDEGDVLWDSEIAAMGEFTDQIYKDDAMGEVMYAGATPVLDGVRAFALFPSGDLVSVDLAAGETMWHRHLLQPNIPWGHIASLLLHDGTLYVPMIDGSDNGGVYALDPNTGETRWFTKIDGFSYASLTVAEVDGKAQIVGYGGQVFGLDPASGEELWRLGDTASEEFGPSPVAADGLIFVGIEGHGFHAYKGDGGDPVWSLTEGVLPNYPSPVVANGKLYILGMRGSLAVHAAATGEKLATADLDAEFWASPIVVGGRLVTTSLAGMISILDGNTAQLLGSYDLQEKVFAAPAIREGAAVFRTANKLVALKAGAAGGEDQVSTAQLAQAEEKKAEPAPVVDNSPWIVEAAAGLQSDAGASSLIEGQWASWRGPHSMGRVPANEDILFEWDAQAGEGIIWKTAVPEGGIGHPIIWDNRVLLTSATASERRVHAYDRLTGAEIWTTIVPTKAGKDIPRVYDKDKLFGTDYMFAASTPATDGQRVYAIFANGDLAALDLGDGSPVWVRDLGVPKNMWGHSQSLIVDQGRLYVAYDQRRSAESAFYAFDAATGAELWKTGRPQSASFSTPLLVGERRGKQLYLVSEHVAAYDPATGKQLWFAGEFKGDVGPTPVYTQDKVFATMKRSGLYCLRANASGDANADSVVWHIDSKDIEFPDMPSPVTDDYRLWTVGGSKGQINCFDVQSGKHLYSHSLDKEVYASPLLIGERILFIDVAGQATWMNAASTPSVHDGGSIGEPVYAAPAVHGADIFIRSRGHLYRIGEKE